jgi:hypothetical protein
MLGYPDKRPYYSWAVVNDATGERVYRTSNHAEAHQYALYLTRARES